MFLGLILVLIGKKRYFYMTKKDKTLYIISLLGLIVISVIFMFDIMFNIPALTVFYVLFVFMALWTDDSKNIIISAIISTILVLTAWFLSSDVFSIDGMGRLLSSVVIWTVAILSAKRSEIELELKRLNETLELRILARTIASERKAQVLEMQIKQLQELRTQNTQQALMQLDDVIKSLKEISYNEVEDFNFNITSEGEKI
jgi:K+-sensing histidine kinase KdpD